MWHPLLVWTFFISTSAAASTTNQVLKSAWSDESLKIISERKSAASPIGSSFIRDSQVFYSRKTDYKKDGSIKHEVGLKIRPYSLEEMKIQKKLQTEPIDWDKLQLSRSLLERYELLIGFSQATKKVELLSQGSEAAMKNFKTQLMASQWGKSDAKKIIKARLDWAKMQRELKEAEVLKSQYADELKKLGVSEAEILKESAAWIGPKEIAAKLEKLDTKSPSLSEQLKQIEIQEIESDYGLSKGRRYSLVDGIEVAYSRPENDSNDTSVELKVSFNLSFLNSDAGFALKSRDFAHKKITRMKEARLVKDFYQANLQRLKDLVATYNQLNGFFKNSDLLKKTLATDPQLGIETLFETLSARSEYLDLEKEILLIYVQVLYESGQISKAPDINYLSPADGRI